MFRRPRSRLGLEVLDNESEQDGWQTMTLSTNLPLHVQQHDDLTPLLGSSTTRKELSSNTDENGNENDNQAMEEDDVAIFDVVDRIEDEIDAHGYEDLVPLELKLALEDTVFGWSHLSSDIMGHVVFTVGAYLIFYIVSTEIQKQFHPFSSDRIFSWTRLLLSLWAAVSAFRMVRRRRRVWFRAAYGSKAYKQDEARRRASVAETDRSTMLGRIRKGRDAFFARSVQRKLRHAEARFDRRRSRRRILLAKNPELPSNSELFTDSGESSDDQTQSSPKKLRPSFQTLTTNQIESIAHDQILFSSGPIQNMPYAHGGFFGAAPFMLANPHWIDILRHLMPDVYVEISRRVVHAPASKLIHWAENNPVVAAYGTAHELETNGRVPNLEWDVFLDPHLVQRVELVLQEKDKFLKSCPSIVNQWSKEQRNIIRYYDRQLEYRVKSMVDHMLIAHGNLTQIIWELTGFAKKYNFSRVKRTRRTLGGGIFARQWLAVYADALRLGMMNVVDNSDLSTVATDSSLEITQQQLQIEHQMNESIEPEQSKSKPAIQSSITLEKTTISPMSIPSTDKLLEAHGLVRGYTSLYALGSSNCPDMTMSQSVTILRNITKCSEPIGLVLDLKSRHVSRRIWALVVNEMRTSGIRIEGIASFADEEVRDISRYTHSPLKEIIFFHSAGDMQEACHSGRIRQGDAIFFNGGSLLWEAPAVTFSYMYEKVFGKFDPHSAKKKYTLLPFSKIESENRGDHFDSTIQDYQRKFNLSIGIYCQEFCIDDAATSILVRLVNDHPQVYNLGFSWGGVNGVTVRNIQPGRFTRTDGFWNQRHVGAVWDTNRTPADC